MMSFSENLMAEAVYVLGAIYVTYIFSVRRTLLEKFLHHRMMSFNEYLMTEVVCH